MTEEIAEFLAELGLTALESRVFISLFDSRSSASELSKKTGIHRRNVYDCLDRLSKRGLVASVKSNNRRIFSAIAPEELLEMLRQRTKIFETLLPMLQSKHGAEQDKNEALLYQGTAGLRLIFNDQIKTGKEILINATTANIKNVLRYFFPSHDLQRKERDIPVRMIVDESYREMLKDNPLPPLCRVRFIREFNRSPISQYIYGDNVAIVVWSEPPSAFLIRQKAVAQGFRESFETFWKITKQ
ncbi:MAG TPA: helix-turn-helix domain-containing protein [Candidatus Nanoarchaeia archaeon]|nr:helix-turn-helix domain-containing protein [Candidatus Nanoarchaeia archaeon]